MLNKYALSFKESIDDSGSWERRPEIQNLQACATDLSGKLLKVEGVILTVQWGNFLF
jgi:hypothetical protein